VNTYKRGIAVLAVLILALSSVFAIQTVNLKKPSLLSSLTSSTKKTTNADNTFEVKGGLAFVTSNFSSSNLSNAYVTESPASAKANLFGLSVGIRYRKYFANIVYAFLGDATIDGFGFNNVKLSTIVKNLKSQGIDARKKIGFFGLSAGFARDLNFGSVNITWGYGLSVNYGVYGVVATIDGFKEQAKITFLNTGVSTLIDARYAINNRLAAGISLNPQIGILTSATASESEGKVSGTTTRLNFAMPVTVGVTYSL
jgi:hypothetical protein